MNQNFSEIGPLPLFCGYLLQGYHPEVKGVRSKDSETVIFDEIMKARLGVDHWIKCIGLHLKFTLRSESRLVSQHLVAQDFY